MAETNNRTGGTSRPRVIGLTGGIGVGKSTAAAELARLGATVVDCDALGRVVVEPDGRAYPGLVDRFGTDVLHDDGTLDRTRVKEALDRYGIDADKPDPSRI